MPLALVGQRERGGLGQLHWARSQVPPAEVLRAAAPEECRHWGSKVEEQHGA